MKFAKWVFLIAGVYGILVTLPLYNEAGTTAIFPPAVNHPEYYYGFASAVMAWQVAFIVISNDPMKYRLLMIPAVLEKMTYVFSIAILALQGRVTGGMLGFAAADLVLGLLFIASFIVTGRLQTK
jgi:hypothetical protein